MELLVAQVSGAFSGHGQTLRTYVWLLVSIFLFGVMPPGSTPSTSGTFPGGVQ